MLQARLDRIHERIRQACQRCGRDPSSVTLIAVTKGVSPELIREAVRCGVTHVGENRVQEAVAKQAALGALPVRWHLIGHLQRNKARRAAELFDVVQSVDSTTLASDLDRHAAARSRALDIMIQVNLSGETTKFGCQPQETATLAAAIAAARGLRLLGLMTIAPFSDDPERARPVFQQLRRLRDQLQPAAPSPLSLSMGMSQDVEVAIEEGADLVRIGTAIFGERP